MSLGEVVSRLAISLGSSAHMAIVTGGGFERLLMRKCSVAGQNGL